jgi:hypothetical protein
VKSADMADYYLLLARRVRETENDPAKLRLLVYEAARLALKRQVNLHNPPLASSETKRHMGDLEDAIAVIEAGAANGTAHVASLATEAEAPEAPEAREPQREEPEDDERDSKEHEEHDDERLPDEEPDGEEPDDDVPAELQAPAVRPTGRRRNRFADFDPVDRPARAQFRAPDRPDVDDHAVDKGKLDKDLSDRDLNNRDSDGRDLHDRDPRNPDSRRHRDRDFNDHRDADERPAQVERIEPVERLEPQAWDEPEDRPSRPQSRELVLLPPRSLGGRGPPRFLVNVDEFAVRAETIYRAPPPPQPSRGRTLLSGAGVLLQLGVAILAGVAFYVAVWGRDPSLPPGAEAPSAASQPARAAARAAPRSEIGTAALAAGDASGMPAHTAPPAAAGPSFPRPAAYGIYAISDNRLIELEQVPTAPVDPRTRTTLQIAKPSRTVISDTKLSFVAYRRDLVASAPEKVPVRVAARIAKSMNFDPTGKAVVTPPTTETWLIRDQGYDMRVSPVRDSPEMVLLRPDSADFSFPSGRYELMLGGQAYDFVIAGAVTDPAQCVEGTATVRGPVFYECKAQ